MAPQIRRRTVLLSGAVASVAAGGLVALSLVRREPAALPPGSVPDLENLPVAEVPAPTDQPVEIVYCAGWDPTTRAPVSPMAESVARAQDAAGEQYAAVLLVGGVARAVVEVCWSAHHVELWNIDADGRRYRGVAYRRWPDGRLRLFEARSWNHDGDTPTFQVRVLRDDTTAIDKLEIVAVQADGSTLQLTREWPDWPERERPPENVAVPPVDGWPRLARMTGPVTIRSGPAEVPTRFPWRPPRPLQPRHVTEMVTDGTRFRAQDGRVLTINRIPAGTIRLPSGRLTVADPGWLDYDPVPLAVTVSPGEYPVDVFQLADLGNAACRVTITNAPVTSWHLAMRDGDHELALGDGEYFGNPVDTATLCLVDHTGVPAYSQNEIQSAMESTSPYRTLSAENTDLVIVPGWSDGSNPVWLGRAEDGTLSCYVLDFLLSDLATAEPE